jgi:hypothetical protein
MLVTRALKIILTAHCQTNFIFHPTAFECLVCHFTKETNYFKPPDSRQWFPPLKMNYIRSYTLFKILKLYIKVNSIIYLINDFLENKLLLKNLRVSTKIHTNNGIP